MALPVLASKRGERGIGAAAAGDAGQRLDWIFNAEHEVRKKERDDLRDESDRDAEEEQRQAVLLDRGERLWAGADPDDADEHGQPEVPEEAGCAHRQCREPRVNAAQPAEQQARQQAAAATADGNRHAPDFERDHADQNADDHADAEEDEIRRGGRADFIADLRLHAIEIDRAPGEVQFVAGFKLKSGEQG